MRTGFCDSLCAGSKEKKSVQYLKTALVCVILFFGSAFTIMTFIEDVSVNKVFNALYTRVTGQVSNGAE